MTDPHSEVSIRAVQHRVSVPILLITLSGLTINGVQPGLSVALAAPTSAPTTDPSSRPSAKDKRTAGLLDVPSFADQDGKGRGDRLVWDPAWPKVGLTDYIVTGTFGLAALAFAIIGPVGSDRWRGGIGVDESVRDALRVNSVERRRFARDASDVMLTSAVSYPWVDALLVAGWYRRSPAVAKEMALINLEVLAVMSGLVTVTKAFSNRERPYARVCGSERPENTRDCDTQDRFFSFFSGHAALSFASAAVNCTHHAFLGLYDRPWADALSCVGGFAAASAASALRIVGDQHYFSDVMVGAAVGSLVGFGIPWLFHYRHKGSKPIKRAGKGFWGTSSLSIIPTGMGASVVGTM